jgi:hypothetical protein
MNARCNSLAAAGGALIVAAIALALPLATEYAETGLVPRFPTAILCSAMTIMGALSILAGLIMDIVTKARQEMKRLFYLSVPPRHRADRWPISGGEDGDHGGSYRTPTGPN